MATSSGNTTTTTSSASEGDMEQMGLVIVDERKRKRMASNRESARRSRVRKQKHVDDLSAQVDSLMRDNNQVVQTINVTTQQFLNVEAENSVLRAQMSELSQRLESLNEMVNYMNTLNGSGRSVLQDDVVAVNAAGFGGCFGDFGVGDYSVVDGFNGNFGNAWNLGFMNQPIMASIDGLQY